MFSLYTYTILYFWQGGPRFSQSSKYVVSSKVRTEILQQVTLKIVVCEVIILLICQAWSLRIFGLFLFLLLG